jgi:MerR family transcriptional regulator, light-induced transcriptional regulator
VATRFEKGAPVQSGKVEHVIAESSVLRAFDANSDAAISNLLEAFIIPRLIAGDHTGDQVHPRRTAKNTADCTAIVAAEIRQFADISVHGDTEALMQQIDRHLANGHSVEGLFINLLAPAARALGTSWEEDSLDFMAVTMGLWRMQEALRELTLRSPPPLHPAHGRRRALFAPVPGEQHSFGIIMVAECFERAGWETDILLQPTQSDLNHQLADRHYDLVALSISCDIFVDTLHGLIAAAKSIAKNPRIRVLIGGRVVNENPALVKTCGADGSAIDAPSALALADHLIPLKSDIFGTLITG